MLIPLVLPHVLLASLLQITFLLPSEKTVTFHDFNRRPYHCQGLSCNFRVVCMGFSPVDTMMPATGFKLTPFPASFPYAAQIHHHRVRSLHQKWPLCCCPGSWTRRCHKFDLYPALAIADSPQALHRRRRAPLMSSKPGIIRPSRRKRLVFLHGDEVLIVRSTHLPGPVSPALSTKVRFFDVTVRQGACFFVISPAFEIPVPLIIPPPPHEREPSPSLVSV